MARKKTFAIIGASDFGWALAKELVDKKQIVKIIDKSEEKINAYVDSLETIEAVISDCLIKSSIKQMGLDQFDHVIVCVSDIEKSLLITMNLIDCNVKNFKIQCKNKQHRRLLRSLDIEENNLVIPEFYSAFNLTIKSLFNINFDITPIDGDYSIVSLKLSEENNFDKSIEDVGLESTRDVSIIQIRREGKIIIPNEYSILKENDILIFFVKNNLINDLSLKIVGN